MYAGADKYGGVVAGEGQPNSENDCNHNGMSLEDTLETAAAEETIVVDIPYTYEDEDGNTISDSTKVLLAAQLNPNGGGLMWIEEDNSEETDTGASIMSYQNAITMSQMTSMLRDKDRNNCYEIALQKAIEQFKMQHGRAPIVLDIGTGTGLLAMMAARHGAEHVYACEMFAPLAQLACEIISCNKLQDKITVYSVRSTDLVVEDDLHLNNVSEKTILPQRADILVSELFDSALLGEAVVSTIRHAQRHLLVPNAVIIPERATIFVKVVENEEISAMIDITCTIPSLHDDDGLSLKFTRNEIATKCTGGFPGIPLHYEAIEEHSTDLTDLVPILSVDFQNMSHVSIGSLNNTTNTPVIACGKAQAVVMWWEVYFTGDNSIKYSTAPRAQNWQDHWVQVVYPLPNYSQEVVLLEETNKNLSITAHTDELHLWFTVKIEKKITDSPCANSFESFLERPDCCCGLHLLCNPERIRALTHMPRLRAWQSAIQSTLSQVHKHRKGLYIGESVTSILDISDGSLASLLALGSGLNGVPIAITSIESKSISSRIFDQILAANVGEIANKSKTNDAIAINELSKLQSASTLCCGCKGLELEHLEGVQSQQPVDLLIGEPFYYAMQNLPVWQALNFWLRRSVLSSLLAKDVQIMPCSARIQVQAVCFENLASCFGTVGEVSGFTHAPFDNFCFPNGDSSGITKKDFPFPVYMYPYIAVSEVQTLAQLDYTLTATSINSECDLLIKNQAIPNAIIIWVEYALDSAEKNNYQLVTGPTVPYSKQTIRFLLDWNKTSERLRVYFQFNCENGTIKLDVRQE